jgi:putative SOS response-associated peptidase YedK
MCAQFALKIEATQLSLKYKIKISDQLSSIDSRFLPHSAAPVIVKSADDYKLTPMRFSLIPSWSSEPKVKFATHNARIESITEKPTWRTPFHSQHCLVPMTSFFESVYDGPEAGHIIRFSEEYDHLLFAAGIFDLWNAPQDRNPSQAPFFSFSILTREPSKFILDHGHDRTPIFLKDDLAFDWLSLINRDDSLIKKELLARAYHPNLKVDIDRPLKAGWQNKFSEKK